jgi:hypothetical protein
MVSNRDYAPVRVGGVDEKGVAHESQRRDRSGLILEQTPRPCGVVPVTR